jgi:hypothetical protein
MFYFFVKIWCYTVYSSGEEQMPVIHGAEGEQFKNMERPFGLTLKNDLGSDMSQPS